MSLVDFDLPKEIQAALYHSPVKPEKISQNQFILGESANKTQRIRLRKNGLITLFSLDINLNDRLSIPVLTVSQEKGKLRVSFALVNPDPSWVKSAVYSDTDGYPDVSTELGFDLLGAKLLLAGGAFPATENGQLPRHINVDSVARNISKKILDLAKTPGGFMPVSVPELVKELFVAK